jgi:light-regulated signal transduction histidine kinase (bacteriophytochrome)
VLGDDTQLLQLLQNLIGNGIKYHHNEPPHVHLSAKKEGHEWIISVQDNGIGIAPRHHERIFSIFDRLHRQEEYPGTGIGLAICQRIVERHGGRIWVESELGRGATFYFTIK